MCKQWSNTIQERGLIQVKIFDKRKEEKKDKSWLIPT